MAEPTSASRRSRPGRPRPGGPRPGGPRPGGVAPGAGMLVGGWLVGAMIARLTGAPAVIVVLGATFVGLAFEVAAGYRTARRLPPPTLVLPPLVSAGDDTYVAVHLGEPTGRPTRLVVCETEGRGGGPVAECSVGEPATTDDPIVLDARFDVAGRVTALDVDRTVFGPAGLVAWRRRHRVEGLDVDVAPQPSGPLLDVEHAVDVSTGIAGGSTGHRGHRAADVDGVRPWRRGDGLGAVHWPTSLRADSLIVHERPSVDDQRWIIDVDGPGVDPARLRWTIDEGLSHGHPVTVRTTDGDEVAVIDHDDAARLAARQSEVARRTAPTPDRRSTIAAALHRQRHVVAPEPTRVGTLSRWAAAGAAGASMGLLAGALGSAPHELALATALIALGAAVSLRIARRDGIRPLWMRAAVAAAIVVALGLIVVDAVEVDNLLAALRGPLPNLLMLLVVLHGFEVVDRRTLRVHQAITLVVATYAAGLRIDAALGWWLAGWAVMFAVSVLSTARVEGARTRSGARAAHTGPTNLQRPLRAVAWTVTGCAVTVGVLSLVPIPDGPARLGLPALSNGDPIESSPGALVGADGAPSVITDDRTPSRDAAGEVIGYPGFTESLDTSIRGTLGDDTVMRVRSPEPAFWRGQTFAEFDGRTWRVAPDLGMAQDGPLIEVPPTIGDAPTSPIESRDLIQTFYVEQDLPNIVFAAYRPTQIIFDGEVWTRPDGALRADVTLTAGSVYTVRSQRLQVDADVLGAQGDLGRFFDRFRRATGGAAIEPFLQLPSTTTQRTIDLATSLRRPGESTYDTIQRYQSWLGANTAYDLDAPVPGPGADAVDDFLFESRRGFCEQIASALTIMLRSQGVPARLATGYVAGERDRLSGVWNVRASDAHAWVEVWFPQTGWEAFDPTASVPLAGDAARSTVGGDVLAAAAAWVLEHVRLVVAAVLAACAATAAVVVVRRRRQRARRGRWGLLQDRFHELGPPTPLTNPQRARSLPAEHADAAAVAELLDRVAFDPTWVDSDADFERARRAVETLEREQRSVGA